MKTTQKSTKKPREDYAGGGSDFPQEAKDAASPQKGMIDDDMGKYGGCNQRKRRSPWTRASNRFQAAEVAGSFHGKKQPSKTIGPKSHGLKS